MLNHVADRLELRSRVLRHDRDVHLVVFLNREDRLDEVKRRDVQVGDDGVQAQARTVHAGFLGDDVQDL